jgi:filamentous hemagglutinin
LFKSAKELITKPFLPGGQTGAFGPRNIRALYKTTKEATEAAAKLGYSRVRGQSVSGQAVYTNGKNFISRDIDSHNGGVWKMADSIKNLGRRDTRMGTYDQNLIRLGD